MILNVSKGALQTSGQTNLRKGIKIVALNVPVNNQDCLVTLFMKIAQLIMSNST